jgi:hypothetical protein
MKEKTYIVEVANEGDVDRLMGSNLNTTILSEQKVRVSTVYPYNDFFNLLANCDVTGLETKQDMLEDVFMKYYGEAGDSNE